MKAKAPQLRFRCYTETLESPFPASLPSLIHAFLRLAVVKRPGSESIKMEEVISPIPYLKLEKFPLR